MEKKKKKFSKHEIAVIVVIIGLSILLSVDIYQRLNTPSCTINVNGYEIKGVESATDMIHSNTCVVNSYFYDGDNFLDSSSIQFNLYENLQGKNCINGLIIWENSNTVEPMLYYQNRLKELFIIVDSYSEDKITVDGESLENIHDVLIADPTVMIERDTYNNESRLLKKYTNMDLVYYYKNNKFYGILIHFNK